jgi:hypothetical protein
MMADLRRLALGGLLFVIATAMPYHYAVVSTLIVSLALMIFAVGDAAWGIFRRWSTGGDDR